MLWTAAALLAVVIALRVWLEVVGPLPGERWSLRHFKVYPGPHEPILQVADLFDVLGRPLIAIVTVAVAAWLIARGLGRRAAVFVLVAFAGVLLNDVLKGLSGPTPLWSASHGDDVALNYPSGHAFYAASFGGALARLALARRRKDLLAFAIAGIALMGPMRVIQGYHLPSDVVAGYLTGAAWLMISIVVVRQRAGESGSAPADRADGVEHRPVPVGSD